MQQKVDTYEQDKADFNRFSAVVRKYVGIKELDFPNEPQSTNTKKTA